MKIEGYHRMFTEFFEKYSRAFLEFDHHTITKMYDFPMVFFSEDGDMVNFQEGTFTENAQKLISLYDTLEVKNVSFKIVSHTSLSKKLHLCTVLWSFQKSDHQEIYNATTRYLLKEIDSTVKVKTVFVVDETSKVSSVLKEK